MSDKIDLAIIFPDSSDQDVLLLKSFFEPFSLTVSILPYKQSSIDQIDKLKIKAAIVYSDIKSPFAQNFIIEASVRKIFHRTTFYYLSHEKLLDHDKIRLMTIGYSGFLAFPFNATDTQNIVDINDFLTRAA